MAPAVISGSECTSRSHDSWEYPFIISDFLAGFWMLHMGISVYRVFFHLGISVSKQVGKVTSYNMDKSHSLGSGGNGIEEW